MNSEALDCLEDYAKLLQSVDRIDDAVRVYAAAGAVRETLALPRSPSREAERQKNVEAARAALEATVFDAAWSTGRTWALDEAVDYALASRSVPSVTA